MKKDKLIADWLRTCEVKSIDELTDEQCCYLYDELYPPTVAASVVDCFEDRQTDDERSYFAQEVRKCLKSEKRITVHQLMNEGVIDDDKDFKHFQHRFDFVIE